MDKRGKIDFKLPSLAAAFLDLPSCDSWIPPCLLPPKVDKEITSSEILGPRGLGSYGSNMETPRSGSQILPPQSVFPDESPFAASPMLKLSSTVEKLKSAEGIATGTDVIESDAEERARAATAAMLGLRRGWWSQRTTMADVDLLPRKNMAIEGVELRFESCVDIIAFFAHRGSSGRRYV